MRFQVLDIGFNPPHPVTGAAVPAADRLNRLVETAVLAEELGFDSFAVGERHAGPVLSSAPTVLLGAVAARTSRILLSTGVTVLSLHDPIRLAEDLATVDQLSRGRLEIVIGKGNEDLQYPLLGLDIAKQYEYLRENYELLRLLLSGEDVTWEGRHRHRLEHATTLPRPYAGPFRIWHGSATSRFAVDLAAEHGDPMVSANALQPRENYGVLIDRYREQYAAAGHGQEDPRLPLHVRARAPVGERQPSARPGAAGGRAAPVRAGGGPVGAGRGADQPVGSGRRAAGRGLHRRRPACPRRRGTGMTPEWADRTASLRDRESTRRDNSPEIPRFHRVATGPVMAV